MNYERKQEIVEAVSDGDGKALSDAVSDFPKHSREMADALKIVKRGLHKIKFDFKKKENQ